MGVVDLSSPLPIVVLISGGGTTLRNLITVHATGNLPVEFRLVISSRQQAGGIAIARSAGIPTQVIRPQDYPDAKSYSDANFAAIRGVGGRLVVMGGFLKHLLIPADFVERIINIHPSLIPAFCGAGMYGLRVHQAVLDFGAKISGCTVHYVDDQYDHGPIIMQRAVPVFQDDTAETLAARVFAAECELYPEAIRQLPVCKAN
jgi:phosphoribosylglycinamide formyltransferase-1